MTAFRFFLILVIFCMVSLAWLVLGGTIEYRTADLKETLAKEVDSRWGPSGLTQPAPRQFAERITKTEKGVEQREWAAPLDPVRTDVAVCFAHSNRYMGLLWFSTYTVEFSGTYSIAKRSGETGAEKFFFALPPNATVLENLGVMVDGARVEAADIKSADSLMIPVPPDGKEHVVTVAYRTQGRDRWVYDLAQDRQESHGGRWKEEPSSGPGQAAIVKKFCLTATTNFRDIDYPKGSASPTPDPARETDGGMVAEWKFENRSTRQQVGIEMPQRQNAGPVAARMAFYAPVSLFFFFTVLFTIILLKQIPLHPMHYLFISAGFFAFHILMAYLVDKINIHHAFWICSLVSVFLVTNYMRLVAGGRFALLYVGGAQLVYLVGFSYAFFATGWTGLTIVVVAILTLFVLMMATGRIDWNAVFSKPPARVPAPPAPPAPPPGA